MTGKTKVRMIKDSSSKNMDKWSAGETGYIDGYCGGGSIAVVLDKKIVICDTWDVEVVTMYSNFNSTRRLTNHIGPK
jgi:hypothetical protein